MKKAKTVLGYNGGKKMVAPGVWAYDAEAIVEDENGRIVYVHMNEYDEMQHYTVTNESLFELDAEEPEDADIGLSDCKNVVFDDEGEPVEVPFVGDPDFEEKIAKFCGGVDGFTSVERIEEYDNLTDASKSAYGHIFGVLNEMVGLMF